MKRVYIMGGSGIGMIAATLIDQLPGMTVAGFINDFVPVNSLIGEYKHIPVVSTTDKLGELLAKEDAFVFNAFVGMKKQEDTYHAFKSLNLPMDKFVNIISPTAIAPEDYCKLGKGCLMAPYSQLSPDTKIGDHCRLLGNCFVGHNTTLNECVSLATNSVLGANVKVGKGVHVGSNATIREKLTIGDFSLVGMGAVVVKDVPPGAIVVGNPAKVLKTV